MIAAGLDIGTRIAKVVILGPAGVLSSAVSPVNDAVDRVSRRLLREARKSAGLHWWQRIRVAATGYGRKQVRAARIGFPEAMCLARGVHHLDPAVRTVVDVGGLITRAVKIGEAGTVLDSQENERCAAGSGRFLELVAEALEVPLPEIGPLSLGSTRPLNLTSQCVVFAESEVISLVNAGEEPADILAGLHRSIAERAGTLARVVQLEPPAVMTGGVARNAGVVHFLEQALQVRLQPLALDPDLVAALGAALLARDGRG